MTSQPQALRRSITNQSDPSRGLNDSQSRIDVARFGVLPDSGQDATTGVLAAIEACRQTRASCLFFAAGRYDFHPDRAFEKYLFVSNNDEGLKRVAFPLMGANNLEIDGQGAMFVFQGPMVPFLVESSTDVTLKNLSFDFTRPFHSEARVLAVTPDSVDVEFSEEFPFEIRNGILVFTSGKPHAGPATTVKNGETLYPYSSLLAFDSERRETAFMAKDRYKLGAGVVAKSLGDRKVRLLVDDVSATPGNILVFGSPRKFPGVVISDSARVTLENVTIHHSGGMAVIAQRSEDLRLSRVKVTPAPGGKRVVSATADATHFVNCRGKIELLDCLFETQKDDATNIHGLYARVSRILSPNRFEIRLIHPQQAGVDFVRPGTRLEITDGPSLVTTGVVTARVVERLNKETTIVETDEASGVEVGNVVADADANTAEVVIRNCVLRGNRARGFLLGSRGKTLVEGNTFHTPGAAILFEGDARHWFEQAGVRDVLIRDNIFDNCNFGVWGKGCIQVASGIADEHKRTSRYNRNIRIEDNLFRVFGSHPLVLVYSVEGLSFVGNRLERTQAYPASQGSPAEYFRVQDSDNVHTELPEQAK